MLSMTLRAFLTATEPAKSESSGVPCPCAGNEVAITWVPARSMLPRKPGAKPSPSSCDCSVAIGSEAESGV